MTEPVNAPPGGGDDAAAQAAAQAAAAAAAAEAAKNNPAPKQDNAQVTEPVPYTADSGSRQLDVALGYFVDKLGLKPDSAEIQELRRTGNIEYIKGHAAQLGKSAEIEPYLALATGGLGELKTATETKQAKLREELEGYAGGKEKFDAAIEFVKANSTDEQRAEFDKILDAGGIGAQALVLMFQSKMSADPNVTTVGKEAVNPNAAAVPAATATTYADRTEWRAAQRGLISKYGNTWESTTEGKALLAAFPA